MLTLILLVVLGGGAGLLAVSLIDSGGLSRLVGSRGASLRGARGAHTPRKGRSDAASGPPVPAPQRPIDTEAEPSPDDAVEPHVVQLAEPPLLERPAPSAPPRLDPSAARTTGVATRQRTPGRPVPPTFTAVEGTYREVAVAPWWRRLLSLLVLVVVVVLLGAAIAVLAGAVLGVAAELVDGAIG